MVKLVVADDEQKICHLLEDFFAARGFKVYVAHDGPSALGCIRQERPHLVFLDLRMPGLDGLDVLREVRNIDDTIKVIIITAIEDEATIQRAKELGATDYVVKPFSLEYLKEEVLTKVSASLYEDLRKLNLELQDSMARLKDVVRGIVAAFSAVVSKIDPHYTHEHVLRSVDYATKIIQHLRKRGAIAGAMQEEVLLAGILLHDIGKIFTPKEILYKPGPLNEDEWVIMRRHPVDGAEILGRIAGLQEIALSVRYHHERWDGKGYPDGLSGEQIPLGARIASVVDVFDAMVSDRPYRKAMSVDQAIAELKRCRGTQFDPMVVDTMIELFNEGRLLPHHDHHHPASRASSPSHIHTY